MEIDDVDLMYLMHIFTGIHTKYYSKTYNAI